MAEVKDGRVTSEFQAAQSGGVWGIVAMILGFLVASGDQILAALGHGTGTAGTIAGAVLACAGIALKTLTSLGYIKSRTEVKIAQTPEAPAPTQQQ